LYAYAGNPEVYGQDGKLLPFPEEVLAHKAQNILQNKDREAKEAVVESEIETREDGTEIELRTNSSQENTSPGAADTKTPAEAVTDTVEKLADQSLHDDGAVDHDLQVKQLLAALAEDNPTEVRLQAIYLLADVKPDLVEKFLDDKDDLIRCEAERIVGILPEE
jgi:hypothetical protein